MSVKPHYNFPGVPQLIVQRANNRDPCFFVEKDYQRYLEILQESANEYNCQIHAYALMPNHVHLLATSNLDNGISQLMQAISRRYAEYVNKTYGTTGPLWEGGYKSCLLESKQYLLACMRYIEQSPVRAKLMDKPDEYHWTSYHYNALNKSDSVIKPHSAYMELASNLVDRLLHYRELLKVQLDYVIIKGIREGLNKQLVLGTPDFKGKIEELSNREKVGGECWDCVMFY